MRVKNSYNSKDEAVAESLVAVIQSGEYANGSMLPTERTLSERFGVSRTTVRGAIAHLKDLGYLVQPPGFRPRVCLASDPTEASEEQSVRTVALICEAIHPSSGADIYRGAQVALQKAGIPLRLTVCETSFPSLHQGSSLEAELLGRLEAGELAGAVLWYTVDNENIERIRRLVQRRTPLVFIDRFPEGEVCDFVATDNHQAVFDAVVRLAEIGHRRVVFISSGDRVNAVREREAAFLDATTSLGLLSTPDVVVNFPPGISADVEGAVIELMSRPHPPTALFAINDFIAHAAINTLRKMNLSVPEDVSVVGFDDLDRYAVHQPMLTSVRQRFREIGQRSMELLIDRLTPGQIDPGLRIQIRLPALLHERSSCAPPPNTPA